MTHPASIDAPWSIRTITPAPLNMGYREQVIFHANIHGSNNVLASPSHISVIQHASTIARDLIYSDPSITILAASYVQPQKRVVLSEDLPPVLCMTTSATIDMCRKIRQLQSAYGVAIVLDKISSLDGYVRQEQPNVIHVNFTILDRAVKAKREYGAQDFYYLRSLFYLVVVICHEYVHGMRYHLLGPVAHTPPSIRGPLAQHVGARLEDAHGTFIRGEGGYFWEKGFLGGVIDFVRNMETLEGHLSSLVMWSRGMEGRGKRGGHFTVGDDKIMRVLTSPQDWGTLLPLTPTLACPWTPGVPPKHSRRFCDNGPDMILSETEVLVGRSCGTGSRMI